MIRPAREGEAQALRSLVRAAYAHYVPLIGREPLPMLDDFAARITANQAWVLEHEGERHGVLVLEDAPDGLLLDNIAVAESQRRQGHGRTMIAFAEEKAKARGHARIWLYTHVLMAGNIALYTRLGFTETHREDRDGRHRVFMEKRFA